MNQFTYEIKAPNVIHLLIAGQPRREIRLEELYVEVYRDIKPRAMVYRLTTDHKDIVIPKEHCVLYVAKAAEADKHAMDDLLDLLVREIVQMVRLGELYKPYTLEMHLMSYIMTTTPDKFSVGSSLKDLTDGRIQVHFEPSKLRVDSYTLKIHALHGNKPKCIMVAKPEHLHPLTTDHRELLKWLPEAMVINVT